MLSSIVIEPWESAYMWFLCPGIVCWLFGVFVWIRDARSMISYGIQILGAVEMALGGVLAFFIGMRSYYSVLFATGQWDPTVLVGGLQYMGFIGIAGIVVHWVLLLASLVLFLLSRLRLWKNAD